MQLQNFYAFLSLKNCGDLCDELRAVGKSLKVLGTVLLAPEGINVSVCGSDESVETFIEFLQHKLCTSFTPCITRFTKCERLPFRKFKVRVKNEIVAFGMPSLNPGNVSCAVGTHVDPWQWNELLRDECTLVIDTRNTYEYCLGHFRNAVNPQTKVFKKFPEFVAHYFRDPKVSQWQNIAMYCTGGIRCEKASAFLKLQYDADVYQLRGGILEYFRLMPLSESLWTGACFVFDDRVVIDSDMQAQKLSFQEVPKELSEYRKSSGHANHIYKKVLGINAHS